MSVESLTYPPEVLVAGVGRMSLAGDWTLAASRLLEINAQKIVEHGRHAKSLIIDLQAVSHLDTAEIGRAHV